MRKILEKLMTFLLIIMAMCVFSFILYISLEFLGMIEVPEQYSFVKFLESDKDIGNFVKESVKNIINYTDESVQNIIKNIDEKEDKKNENVIVVELQGNNVTTIQLEGEQQLETSVKEFKYYNQLNEYAQKMYDALERDKDKLKTGNYTFDFGTQFNDLLNQENGSNILNNSFQLAINSFAYDHPEIFYIDITKMYLLTETTTRTFSKTHKVAIGPNERDYLYDEYNGQTDVEVAISQIEQIKSDILENTTGNTYDKLKYIHDYLIENTEYEKDIETHNNYNIYGVLLNKKAVCEGYAKTFKYILDDLYVPCVMVCGDATNSAGDIESHAWNYVQMDGKWYAIDVTWDDPVIIGFGYVSNETKYKYFLKGSNEFFEDHVEDGAIIESANFTYPILSNLNYSK